MPLYEYDSEGFFVREHEDANRPSSTTKPNYVTPLAAGRFMDGEWVCDRSRQDVAEESDRVNAKSILSNYDPATATAAEVRIVLKALIRFIRRHLGD